MENIDVERGLEPERIVMHVRAEPMTSMGDDKMPIIFYRCIFKASNAFGAQVAIQARTLKDMTQYGPETELPKNHPLYDIKWPLPGGENSGELESIIRSIVE